MFSGKYRKTIVKVPGLYCLHVFLVKSAMFMIDTEVAIGRVRKKVIVSKTIIMMHISRIGGQWKACLRTEA